MTPSDCNYLAHIIVFWQIQKLMLCTVLALFCFVYEGTFPQVQAPGGLIFGGAI